MRDSFRTFVAVEVSADVRVQALRLIGRLSPTSAKIHWVREEQLHLTLQFLGDVSSRQVPEICQQVAVAAAPWEPFDLVAVGAGAFPDVQRPRTIWIGVRAGAQQMMAVQQAVEQNLARLGFRGAARRYVPHLTIGRVRNQGRGMADLKELLVKNESFSAGSTAVSELVVYSSQLGPSGPSYTVLGRAPLVGS